MDLNHARLPVPPHPHGCGESLSILAEPARGVKYRQVRQSKFPASLAAAPASTGRPDCQTETSMRRAPPGSTPRAASATRSSSTLWNKASVAAGMAAPPSLASMIGLAASSNLMRSWLGEQPSRRGSTFTPGFQFMGLADGAGIQVQPQVKVRAVGTIAQLANHELLAVHEAPERASARVQARAHPLKIRCHPRRLSTA